MYLTEISHFPSFSPFRATKKNSLTNNFDLISRSFDESLLRRLKSLTSTSNPPSISLSWFSLAFDFLSSTHAEAQNLIANLKLSSLDDSNLALYFDDTVKILDLCNSISSEIERFRQRRLLLNFVLHLIDPSGTGDRPQIPAPENLRRAKNSLADWGKSPSPGLKRRTCFNHNNDLEALIGDLAARLANAPPRGKISGAGRLIRRTIQAVGLVTVFFAGVVLSALYGKPELVAVGRVPAEFLWANSFNDLNAAIFSDLKRRIGEASKNKGCFEELGEVERHVKEMCDVIDDVERESEKRVNDAVKELKKATEAFSVGLDGLSDSVDKMFETVVGNRKCMLENVRVKVGKEEKLYSLQDDVKKI